jgi:Ca2+-transporting ATPase
MCNSNFRFDFPSKSARCSASRTENVRTVHVREQTSRDHVRKGTSLPVRYRYSSNPSWRLVRSPPVYGVLTIGTSTSSLPAWYFFGWLLFTFHAQFFFDHKGVLRLSKSIISVGSMCNITNGSGNATMGANGDATEMRTGEKTLDDKATRIRDLVKLINEPQALSLNLQHLQAAGGVDVLLELLGTSPDTGVSEDSVQKRREILGSNTLPSTPRKSFLQLFVDTFDDATLQILIVAAIVSLVIGIYDDPATGYVEGMAILAACLIVSVVTAINDYQKESQFRELSAANDDVDVVVVRSGKFQSISVDDIVVGDLVCLEAGDNIPCDGVLVRYDGLEVDESALTGEPEDIDKDAEIDPFLLSGCTAIAGSGRFVAIAVGKQSQWGVIQSHLEKEQEETPLQEKLDTMAAMIGYVGMGAAAATFIAMMFIKIVVNPVNLQDISIFHHALDAFIIGVTIVVVAVPEGLPLAVTIALAFSTKKMLADQNLIRHLSACETMGNATNICSDKTGTLTENRMTVVRGMFANQSDTDCTKPVKISKAALETILECISCCSTARILPAAKPKETNGDEVLNVHDSRPQLIGNKTEAAMILLAQSEWGSNDDTDKRREQANFGKEGGSRLFPFSSSRKRMTVLVNKKDSGWTLYHKGAAEVIIENCTTYMEADGTEKKLTAAKRKFFNEIIQEYASDALRCVALCHRTKIDSVIDNPFAATLDDCEKKLEKEMCLDVLFGIADPLREDVIDAVATCQRAGIFVRMVTGDNIETARAIAKQAGILTESKFLPSWLVGNDRTFTNHHIYLLFRWFVHDWRGIQKTDPLNVG